MIQLQRLEGFYWVVKTEGYARATRAFPYPITQPGVHQQVRRLEDDLGLELLTRVGKDRMVPTAAGRALFDFVAPFYEGLQGLERALKCGTQGGRLRVHAASLLLRHLLPAWLRRLQSARPDIELVLSEIHTPDLEPLRLGQADLLVDHLPQVPSDIEARVIGTLHTFIALPSNHALAKRKRVVLKDLEGETFIAYNRDEAGRSLQLRALELSNVRPGRMYGADSAETILGFVAAGIGFSIVPAVSDTGPKFPGIVSFPVALAGSRLPVHVAWKKGGAPNPLREAALALAPNSARRAT